MRNQAGIDTASMNLVACPCIYDSLPSCYIQLGRECFLYKGALDGASLELAITIAKDIVRENKIRKMQEFKIHGCNNLQGLMEVLGYDEESTKDR